MQRAIPLVTTHTTLVNFIQMRSTVQKNCDVKPLPVKGPALSQYNADERLAVHQTKILYISTCEVPSLYLHLASVSLQWW